MKMLIRGLSLVLLAAITTFGAEVPKDPEEMAGYFLRQMQRFNFDEVEEHTSLEDAKRYKELHVQAARLAEQSGAKSYLDDLVTLAASSADLEKMPPKKVYVEYVRGRFEMLRTKFPDLYASMIKQCQAMKIEVVGHTMDGPDRMLVNYRVTGTVDGKTFSEIKVQPLRKEDNDWMLGIEDANFTMMNKTIGQLQKVVDEQNGAGPASAPESKLEGVGKPRPEPMPAPR